MLEIEVEIVHYNSTIHKKNILFKYNYKNKKMILSMIILNNEMVELITKNNKTIYSYKIYKKINIIGRLKFFSMFVEYVKIWICSKTDVAIKYTVFYARMYTSEIIFANLLSRKYKIKNNLNHFRIQYAM